MDVPVHGDAGVVRHGGVPRRLVLARPHRVEVVRRDTLPVVVGVPRGDRVLAGPLVLNRRRREIGGTVPAVIIPRGRDVLVGPRRVRPRHASADRVRPSRLVLTEPLQEVRQDRRRRRRGTRVRLGRRSGVRRELIRVRQAARRRHSRVGNRPERRVVNRAAKPVRVVQVVSRVLPEKEREHDLLVRELLRPLDRRLHALQRRRVLLGLRLVRARVDEPVEPGAALRPVLLDVLLGRLVARAGDGLANPVHELRDAGVAAALSPGKLVAAGACRRLRGHPRVRERVPHERRVDALEHDIRVGGPLRDVEGGDDGGELLRHRLDKELRVVPAAHLVEEPLEPDARQAVSRLLGEVLLPLVKLRGRGGGGPVVGVRGGAVRGPRPGGGAGRCPLAGGGGGDVPLHPVLLAIEVREPGQLRDDARSGADKHA